jgi:hypothetical protein
MVGLGESPFQQRPITDHPVLPYNPPISTSGPPQYLPVLVLVLVLVLDPDPDPPFPPLAPAAAFASYAGVV